VVGTSVNFAAEVRKMGDLYDLRRNVRAVDGSVEIEVVVHWTVFVI